MTQAIIWFLIGYVSGVVVGLLTMAVVAAKKEKEDGKNSNLSFNECR